MAVLFSNILDHFKRKNKKELKKTTTSPQDKLFSFYVQLAVYDSIYNPPRVLYINSNEFNDLTHTLANETFSFASEKGGQIPYVSIKEIIENLIHANFKDVVITVLANGNTIRIADQGPGIQDKQKVFLPGFSTATTEMKRFIKGVGSGLTIASEALGYFSGQIFIEDNLGTGSVVTLHIPSDTDKPSLNLHDNKNLNLSSNTNSLLDTQPTQAFPQIPDSKKLNEILSSRQKKILLLIAETSETGPSYIAKELNMSLSTAYRELVYLEELHLVNGLNSGKRKLTEYGLSYIGSIFE